MSHECGNVCHETTRGQQQLVMHRLTPGHTPHYIMNYREQNTVVADLLQDTSLLLHYKVRLQFYDAVCSILPRCKTVQIDIDIRYHDTTLAVQPGPGWVSRGPEERTGKLWTADSAAVWLCRDAAVFTGRQPRPQQCICRQNAPALAAQQPPLSWCGAACGEWSPCCYSVLSLPCPRHYLHI